MTINILFIANNKLVLRVNMGVTSLLCKILNELPQEDVDKWIPNFEDDGIEKTFTAQAFIEKVWDACVAYRYISEDYDILGKFLDMMKIK